MNIKLTKVIMFAMIAIMMMVSVNAFSETYSDARNEVVVSNSIMHKEPVNITLVKNGESVEYTFFPSECSDLLAFAGVGYFDVHSLSIDRDDVLNNGDVIDLLTVEYEVVTVEETEPCGYDITYVDTVPKGELSVVDPGVDGKKNVTYRIKYVGGEQVEKTALSEVLLNKPVKGTAMYGIGGTVTARDGTVYNYSYRKRMEATAYTYIPGMTTMTTATGQTLRKGIIAVDPRVIPYHTKMYVASSTFEYGYGIAEDCGGGIKGDKLDLAYMSVNECVQFGRRKMWAYILEE